MIFRFDDYELDADRYELRSPQGAIAVEPQVFELLRHLVANRERVVTKNELLDTIWGDRFVSESALSSRVKDARRAVGDDGTRQRRIKTIHGRGYRFVGDVTELTAAGAVAPEDPGGDLVGQRVARPRTRYARSNGGAIAYQVVGEGPPDLVVIPGFASNVELQWDYPPMAGFLSRLASFARVIVFDKRGTGLSERVAPTDHLSLDERISDVTAVMDTVGVGRTSIMGISEGGPMAVMLAATQPERVERLVLCNTFGGDFLTDATWSLDDVERYWGTGTVFLSLAPSWAGEDARRFFARYERNSATPTVARTLLGMNGEIDVRPVLSSVQAPTLVLHRTGDAIVPSTRGRELADGIEGAEFVELPGTDHLAYVDAGELLDHVESFLLGSIASRPIERVLATLMFVDVVGSTESLQRVGDSTWSRMLDQYQSLVSRHVASAQGSVVSTSGDGVLCRFATPARAVLCGLALLDELRTVGLTARIGVHTGEIEERRGDVAGVHVHVGARVAGIASPGEVWITRTVRDLVAGSGLRFADRGHHPLKGFDHDFELLAAVPG